MAANLNTATVRTYVGASGDSVQLPAHDANGVPVAVGAGVTARLWARTDAGVYVIGGRACTVAGGRVLWQPELEDVAVSGTYTAQVQLVDAQGRARYLRPFQLEVLEGLAPAALAWEGLRIYWKYYPHSAWPAVGAPIYPGTPYQDDGLWVYAAVTLSAGLRAGSVVVYPVTAAGERIAWDQPQLGFPEYSMGGSIPGATPDKLYASDFHRWGGDGQTLLTVELRELVDQAGVPHPAIRTGVLWAPETGTQESADGRARDFTPEDGEGVEVELAVDPEPQPGHEYFQMQG